MFPAISLFTLISAPSPKSLAMITIRNTGKLRALTVALIGLLTSTNAFAASDVSLKSDDFVGVSFWMISMALVAATAFFFLETQRVTAKWKTSLTVSGLVTLVAAWHYFYMRDVWVATGTTPTVYRYIDWMITVPLLMVEFYLILSAITKVPAGVFWRLMIGTFVMLIAGFMGEAGYMAVWPAFIISMAGWIFIIWEIYAGQAGKINADLAPAGVQSAFKLMRAIVVFGWAIYPIGYFLGYLTGSGPESSSQMLNVVYNLADVVNKIGFGVIIWTVAVSESEKSAVK
jgi:bacteriorhodopsin